MADQNQIADQGIDSAGNQTLSQPQHQSNTSGNQDIHRHTLKIPNFDPAEGVEQYFARVDYWFQLSNINSEQDRFRCIMPYLPAQMFREVKNDSLETHDHPYVELKRRLIEAFAMDEFERVRKLTERIELGNKKPGDLLKEMQDLCATGDERVLKTLWMNRLPAELAAGLATSVELPISILRTMANTIHSIATSSGSHSTAQSVSQVSTNHTLHAGTAPPGFSELVASIAQLTQVIQQQHSVTVAAIQDRQGRSLSRGRETFRARSASNSSEPDFDHLGRCWYHRRYGNEARKCKPGCSAAGVSSLH